MSTSSTHLSDLIRCNLDALATASNMLEQLPADKYNHVEKPYFESCLGKHLRHILDHYLCFKRDLASGTIDYDQRQRNSQLETSKEYAATVITSLQLFLQELSDSDQQDKNINVLMCSDVSLSCGESTHSSVRRELQFLQAHTVHHFALIATMLRFYGIEIQREFGIAPSTLVHETCHEKTHETSQKTSRKIEQVKIPA